MVVRNDTVCDATLSLIAGRPPGSEVVFDFIVRNELLTPLERAFSDAAAGNSTLRGEPWLTYFDPNALEALLVPLGFTKIERLTPQHAGSRYYAGQPPDVTPLEAWQLVSAQV
jgi:O-methyltransferase involved in polyketide biosynthesis